MKKITELTWHRSSQHGLLHLRRKIQRTSTHNHVFLGKFHCVTHYLFYSHSFYLYLDLSQLLRPTALCAFASTSTIFVSFSLSLSVSVFFQFDWHTNLGSATFLEPCSKFLENLKEVSSGVELKMVHVLTCLTMQFRWEVTATFLKWMRGTRQNHQNIIIIIVMGTQTASRIDFRAIKI